MQVSSAGATTFSRRRHVGRGGLFDAALRTDLVGLRIPESAAPWLPKQVWARGEPEQGCSVNLDWSQHPQSTEHCVESRTNNAMLNGEQARTPCNQRIEAIKVGVFRPVSRLYGFLDQ